MQSGRVPPREIRRFLVGLVGSDVICDCPRWAQCGLGSEQGRAQGVPQPLLPVPLGWAPAPGCCWSPCTWAVSLCYPCPAASSLPVCPPCRAVPDLWDRQGRKRGELSQLRPSLCLWAHLRGEAGGKGAGITAVSCFFGFWVLWMCTCVEVLGRHVFTCSVFEGWDVPQQRSGVGHWEPDGSSQCCSFETRLKGVFGVYLCIIVCYETLRCALSPWHEQRKSSREHRRHRVPSELLSWAGSCAGTVLVLPVTVTCMDPSEFEESLLGDAKRKVLSWGINMCLAKVMGKVLALYW